MTDTSTYTPPRVWQWDMESGGKFANINRPIADMATYPWYGSLVMGTLYEAQEFLDVGSYSHVIRWASEVHARPAVQRGRRVNRAWGPEEEQLLERHAASDLD